MVIQEGYDGKPTDISIRANEPDSTGRKAQIWIEQEGLVPQVKTTTIQPAGSRLQSETLAYATLEELLELRDECNAAIQELVK